jgi:hypothetical protein
MRCALPGFSHNRSPVSGTWQGEIGSSPCVYFGRSGSFFHEGIRQMVNRIRFIVASLLTLGLVGLGGYRFLDNSAQAQCPNLGCNPNPAGTCNQSTSGSCPGCLTPGGGGPVCGSFGPVLSGSGKSYYGSIPQTGSAVGYPSVPCVLAQACTSLGVRGGSCTALGVCNPTGMGQCNPCTLGTPYTYSNAISCQSMQCAG